MSTREELIDSMIHKTLMEMCQDWSEVEITHEEVYLFAHNKLDYPVTQEDVELSLKRKLSTGLGLFPLGEFEQDLDGAVDEFYKDIVDALMQRGVALVLRGRNDFAQVLWTEYSYDVLQAVHKVLQEYGSDDLLLYD